MTSDLANLSDSKHTCYMHDISCLNVQVLQELKRQQQQKQAAKAPSQLSALFSETKAVKEPPAFSFGFS